MRHSRQHFHLLIYRYHSPSNNSFLSKQQCLYSCLINNRFSTQATTIQTFFICISLSVHKLMTQFSWWTFRRNSLKRPQFTRGKHRLFRCATSSNWYIRLEVLYNNIHQCSVHIRSTSVHICCVTLWGTWLISYNYGRPCSVVPQCWYETICNMSIHWRII